MLDLTFSKTEIKFEEQTQVSVEICDNCFRNSDKSEGKKVCYLKFNVTHKTTIFGYICKF